MNTASIPDPIRLDIFPIRLEFQRFLYAESSVRNLQNASVRFAGGGLAWLRAASTHPNP